jgi:serine phosphatase RsbU (regulator of sigma subunit)/anti-sigma regulatory factor (Ser/Thr protein kinase)
MTAESRTFFKAVLKRKPRVAPQSVPLVPEQRVTASVAPIEIAPNDPIVAYLQEASGAVDIQALRMDSPALDVMKEAKIQLVVPLVSQGELIGLLNLGPRLSQQEYSADDRGLLNNLAAQATPAVRVAQLVRQQQAEAAERQRVEQELQVARLIQHTLLPKSVPDLEGWHLEAHYRPARAVGGDFYDFIQLEDGRLGLVVGDVTDKGVPAALVMATTRSVMRAAAARFQNPGEVLEHVNNTVYPDIPVNMFVTCLYAILDPVSGRLVYANAGHDLPYQRSGDKVIELHARGMPLGLMPDMQYEESETQLEPGDTVLLYSDGLVEAHNAKREMFSFPRLRGLVGSRPATNAEDRIVDFLLDELAEFTGPEWEQEDDITLVTLQRAQNVARLTSLATDMLAETDEPDASDVALGSVRAASTVEDDSAWKTLAEFSLPSEEGNERVAMRQVSEAVAPLALEKRTLENLETAVSEATMNAMEHGNGYRSDVPVALRVDVCEDLVRVSITDQGESTPDFEPEEPDLELKLSSMQTPRGWGLFLIKNMVDDMQVVDGEAGHTLQLTMRRKGAENDG